MQIEILEYANKAGILLPVLILVVLIVYMPKAIELIDSWKMRKITYLSTLYSNELLTEDIQKMLKDEINNTAFQNIHGIRVGTLLREQLIKLHNQDRDRFTWKQIRMANPYIRVSDKEVIVKISWIDKFMNLLSIIGLLATIVLYAISWIIFAFKLDWNTFSMSLLVSVGSGIMFFMFAYQLAQYHHAKLLKKAIDELKEKENI